MPDNQENDASSSSSAEAQRVSPTKNLFRKMFDMKTTQQQANQQTHHQGQPLPTPLEIRSPESGDGTYSPTSPEFDSISSLPTPVVGESPASALSPGFAPIRAPPRAATKKSYGALTTRPSLMDNKVEHNPGASRMVSEYGSVSSIDRYSNASSKSTLLNPRLNGGPTSPQKRTVSTPLQEQAEGLEREEPAQAQNTTVSSDVFYRGVDNAGNKHTWRRLRQLGQGTFSTVVLGESVDNDCLPDLRQVAIKVVELPRNKETRTRVESSLRRELDVLRSLNHPCIIKLLALGTHDEKYCIATAHCEGGDLFDLAAKYRDQLKPLTIRRIFAETACAVAYLHSHNIVHRDIKLENVLVNILPTSLVSLDRFGSSPLITLTDFGLSRTIDPANPLLTTRCGSEDYVPPELLIGLPYDGRQSDSWALGVLLYAIMESRLPFDPPPSKSIRARSRVAHRIARMEWAWSMFDDENKGTTWSEEDWSGAKTIVENLLVRREKRLTSKDVVQTSWVNDILPDRFRKA